MSLACFDSPALEALPFEEIVDCDGVQQEAGLWKVVHCQHDQQVIDFCITCSFAYVFKTEFNRFVNSFFPMFTGKFFNG